MALPGVLTPAGDPALEAAAARALALVEDGAHVGLGSGRAAATFIALLGARVRAGLRVVGVPTSEAAASQARRLGIPLVTLDEHLDLDLTIDGADEVTPDLDLVKGHGGAMVRERIVATASRRQVIVVGREKLVRRIGERGPLPLEVIPFAMGPVLRRVKALGLLPVVRATRSENGNLTFDCTLPVPLADRRAAEDLESVLRALPGVVDTGLFLGTAERVLVGHPDGRVDELLRNTP